MTRFGIVVASVSVGVTCYAFQREFAPKIPITWDDAMVRTLELPLAYPPASPVEISSEYYYQISERQIYKTYPLYAPSREPAGYLDWLKQQEPEIIFDRSRLKSEEDWIHAGGLVFDSPNAFSELNGFYEVRNPAFYDAVHPYVTRDGTLPYLSYVIREKGRIEVGRNGCGTCHTRVMPDGTIVKGAQGNWAFDQAQAFAFRNGGAPRQARQGFGTPWLDPDPHLFDRIDNSELIKHFAAIPPGVMSRTGTSVYHPVQVPDLIGLKDRKYFDHTGLVRHRSIGDLMRYAALNQGADLLSSFDGFVPQGINFKTVPPPGQIRSRYSDEQLYALSVFVYSLTPPPNPNRFDARAQRGQKVFEQEGCGACHTPPAYTNNKLTPVSGFKVPEEHKKQFDIMNVSVGTDPFLAMKTRRGTGYYKVPSLKGVWYRGPFGHDGSVATLEDWLDPKRLGDDYVPTGFKGYGVTHRAVPGHPFGLKLSEADRGALIAFLKTL